MPNSVKKLFKYFSGINTKFFGYLIPVSSLISNSGIKIFSESSLNNFNLSIINSFILFICSLSK